jgi:hypothetical protein
MKIPLTNAQITQFVMEKNYTDYFSLQQYLTELVDSDLLQPVHEKHTTHYSIQKKGEKALEYFLLRIPASTREEIDAYIQANRQNIKKEIEITAEYIPEKQNEYIVHCKVKENDIILIDLKVNVASKEQAKVICKNWKKDAQTLYGSILSELVQSST